MTGPRLGMGMPVDESWIGRRFDDLQRQLNELRAARSLEAATIGTGGITVAGDGSIRSAGFDGDVDTATPGTVGWALGGQNGNAVFNDIALRGGIIGDDALANPISAADAQGSAYGLTISATPSSPATVAVPVPEGFSTALCIFNTAYGAQRGTTASGSLNLQAGAWDDGTQQILQNSLQLTFTNTGTMAVVTQACAGRMTNITGHVNLNAQVFGSAPDFVAGSGFVTVTGLVVFLR